MIRYCRAYETAELSGYPELERAVAAGGAPPEIVYLWTDHTVTALPLADAEPLFASDDARWHELCDRLLGAGGLLGAGEPPAQP